ncbi:RcnB family protein [Enterobacteriaceae bacterium LUAb1]
MRKIVLFTAGLLLGNIPLLVFAENNSVPHPQAQKPDNAQTFEIKQFIVNYQSYRPGDILPANFLEKQYQITDWKKRHLSAPPEGSHWAYLDGNYILLSDTSAKVLQAVSGDIYFR